MKPLHHPALALAAAVGLSGSAAVSATDAELQQQVRALIARVSQLESQLAQEHAARDQQTQPLDQKVRVLERKLEIQEEAVAAQAAADLQKGVKVSHNGRSIKFASKDGNFVFQPGGRVQVDAAHYLRDRQALGDGTAIRRARLSAQGTVYRDWDYKVEYEFSDSKANPAARGIRDAYVSYTGWRPVTVTIGNFKEPFSFEQVTSDSAVTFLERSLIDVFAPSRHIGAGVQTAGANWSLAGGVFGERPEDDVASEGDEGLDLTGRATWAPWWDNGRVLHLGVAVRRHEPNDSTNGLRFASRPETNITDLQLVDTGVLTGTDDLLSYGLELAGAWGPWSLQGEYIGTRVDRAAGDDADLDGWYVLTSWFLTGETRPYKAGEGVFDRVAPTRSVGQGGGGAWELALRLSELDLNDAALTGGLQRNLTAGVNWHLTPSVKLQANYIRVLEVDRPGAVSDGDEPSAYTLRAQADF
jgi:phosphate-selective porin OprO/OprP